jgi:hypothetical protein
MTLFVFIVLCVCWGLAVALAETIIGWNPWVSIVLCLLGGLGLAAVMWP